MTLDANIFPKENEIPEKYNKIVNQTEYLIGGKIENWTGPVQEILSPVMINNNGNLTQKYLGSHPMMDANTSLKALDAAVTAYGNGRGEWPTMSVKGRLNHMYKFMENMKQAREEVVSSLVMEIGKSEPDSYKEFDRTVKYIDDTINAVKKMYSESSTFVKSENQLAQIRRAPLGINLSMGPYNYPLNETFTTLIPSVIMGNTVVFKAAKYGVLLHQPLLKAYQESFPAGVINTIYGEGPTVIGPIMESGMIDVFSFIGSEKTAAIIKKQHNSNKPLKSVLGLGAKNLGLVTDSADLAVALSEIYASVTNFNQQRCTSLKELMVQRAVADEFVSKIVAMIDSTNWGMPWKNGVIATPIPDFWDNNIGGYKQMKFYQDLIDDALSKGAQVVNKTGNQNIGTFFSPTVLYGVNKSMRIYHEEQFGPIIPITVYDNINEPINYCVESKYGQQASIFSRNPEEIGYFIDHAINQEGRVHINNQGQRGPDDFPFGGTKLSAEQTLSVSDAPKVFSRRVIVSTKYNDVNIDLVNKVLDNNLSQFLSTRQIL